MGSTFGAGSAVDSVELTCVDAETKGKTLEEIEALFADDGDTA